MTLRTNPCAVFFLILTTLVLAACDSAPQAASSVATSASGMLLPMENQAGTSLPCVDCVQATLSAILTEAQIGKEAQAAATAEVIRINAQATLNAVSATMSAAQTQEQDRLNIISAQLAATAQIDRANAQATLLATGSTQSAAQTQDAIRETQVQGNMQMTADMATQNASGTATQLNKIVLAAGTQTAVSEWSATQTQSANLVVQARQRHEQDQMAMIGMWCLLISVPVFAGLGIGIFLRWIKNRAFEPDIAAQRDNPDSMALPPIIIEHIDNSTAKQNNSYPLAKPADHVRQWLDEVRRKLIRNKKDDDNAPRI